MQKSIVLLLQHRHWHALPHALPFLQLALGFLRRRHAAAPYHGFGEGDGGALVEVFAVNMFAVQEAASACVLDAPGASAGGPFDLGPQLSIDGEVVSVAADLADLDDAVAAPVG